MAQKHVAPFTQQQLETICQIIAEEITGSQIGMILIQLGVPNDDSQNPKWKRLYNALGNAQNTHHYGDHTINFIHRAFDPVRWIEKKDSFNKVRINLNKALAFSGLELMETGKVRIINKISTIDEAEKRADRLRSILKERNVHANVLSFCKAELLNDNYFHAVLEATKSMASKIRHLSGLNNDGADLATRAFSLGKNGIPLIAINLLRMDTERSEQTGFMNLVIGLFGTFRNTTAHAAKIEWNMPEEDALDILGIISLVHRKLDKSYIYK